MAEKRKREEPNLQERESDLRRASSLLPAAKAKQIATFPAPFMDYMKESGLATHNELLNLLSTSHKESASRDYFIKAHTKLQLNDLDDKEAERFVSMYKPFERIYVAKSIEEIGNKRAQMATD